MCYNVAFTTKGIDYEKWDSMRYADDHEFLKIVDSLSSDDFIINNREFETESEFRFRNLRKVEKLVIKSKTIKCKERFHTLLQILLDNPDVWVYFSH